jgi:hypothetical protein
MALPLDEVCCASVPLPALAALAGLRCLPGLRAALDAHRAWVLWEAGNEEVLRAVLPLAGAELYLRREGLWYRLGSRLPSFNLPVDAGTVPLHQALVPEPVCPTPPPEARPCPREVRLVRDNRPRPATGLECTLVALARWADRATAAELGAVEAARAGGRALVLGSTLPALAGATRLWGGQVLIPLGYRPEPALPEGALREALGIGDDEIAVLSAGGTDVVPRAAFRPLTRAGVRLAVRQSH